MDRDPLPDPEPVPAIVLHPGDTIATGAFAGDRYVNSVRLLDRSGVCYAVLDGERDAAGHGWRIHAIRSVGAIRRRELLPIHSQPEPDPIDQSHHEPLPVGNSITVANAYSATISVARPINGSGEFCLTHSHSHTHTGGAGDWDAGNDFPHAHEHAHRGADAHRAGQYGHGLDPHAHPHPPDAAA
jgi:hypothetical protein